MNKNRVLQALGRWYVQRRLKRTFLDVRLRGFELLREAMDQGPLIVAANHVCWWDPLVLVQLERSLRADGYALMDARNLRQLPFFGAFGALPLDLSSARAAHRDLRDAGGVLSAPRRILVVFPQGQQSPAHLPLEFRTGVSHLARSTGAPVVPLALRYDFTEGPRAVVHLSAGPPLLNTEARARVFTARLCEAVSDELKSIDARLMGEPLGFISLLRRKQLALDRERLPALSRALGLLTKGSP